MLKYFLMILCFICVNLGTCAYAQVYQPGFRTIGISDLEPKLRLDVAIWYPTLRQPKEIAIPPWNFTAALNARPAEGRFPLIILSHGSPTERLAYHQLSAFLAKEGFVIAAPTHGRDSMYNMEDLFTWRQLETRTKEIRETLSVMLSDKEVGPFIDETRVGLIGFGSGATAALLLGGASPNCNNWSRYRAASTAADPYRSAWAEDRLNALCQTLPLKISLADQRIKAIAAIAPGFGMLFDESSFNHLYPPVLLVSLGRDHFNQVSLHFAPIAALLGKKAKLLDLPMADTGALLSQCSEILANDLPEMCNSVSAREREKIHSQFDDAILAFFRHYLVITKNIPIIPAQPETKSDIENKIHSEKEANQNKAAGNAARSRHNQERQAQQLNKKSR